MCCVWEHMQLKWRHECDSVFLTASAAFVRVQILTGRDDAGKWHLTPPFLVNSKPPQLHRPSWEL